MVDGQGGVNPLWDYIQKNDIGPSFVGGYEFQKLIYRHHPLGRKIIEKPVKMAIAGGREYKLHDSSDGEPLKRFKEEWKNRKFWRIIFRAKVISRIYGQSSVTMLAREFEEGFVKKEGLSAFVDKVLGRESEPVRKVIEKIIPGDQRISLWDLPKYDLAFNVLDPLNTGGSIVLDEDVNSFNFGKEPESVRAGGAVYGPGRCIVLLNSTPIYISWIPSAYGFSGAPVCYSIAYQLKSYLESTIPNNMMSKKAGVLIAKSEQGSSAPNEIVQESQKIKASMVRDISYTGVLNIGLQDSIESLNLQNCSQAIQTARENDLKDIAAGADMPAQMLTDETLSKGFASGEPEFKLIMTYVKGIQNELDPIVDWLEEICMHLAWTDDFINKIKQEDKEEYKGKSNKAIFLEWKNNFQSEWPDLMKESEKDEVERLKSIFAVVLDTVRTLLPVLGSNPFCLAQIIDFLQSNINAMEKVFKASLDIDIDELKNMPEGELVKSGGDGETPAEIGLPRE